MNVSQHPLTGRARVVMSIVGIAVFIAAWQVVAVTISAPSLLPGPAAVVARLNHDAFNPLVWQATATTCAEAIVGCLIGSAVALVGAYAIYRNSYIGAACSPLVAISQSIPAVAIAPILVIWIGYGIAAIAVLCAIVVFFPILVTTVLGLRAIDKDILDAAHLDGAFGFTLLLFIEAPLALPAILAGLRQGFTLSIIGAVVGEFVMGGHGLGARLSLQSASADMTGLFSTISVLCILAAAAFSVLSLIESWESANRLGLADPFHKRKKQ